ncbi:uncharacterized protein DUF664 [Motilibacter peucedani]|uniref:Uncharacterized protein DUF664 n=1 Tax=Motilibacter peucedani TaxID=598650 RepID=A0A420XS30_9ACTN|nr:DinB family protein [Motilibacter peucedani]RKS77684.1 uncharacterized protein DUF664 [Motilibacter peucedani]
MTESQREPVPRPDGSELEVALAFLGFVRSSVLKKTSGLDEQQLRRPGVPSGTSLLGLVHHLTGCERYWFGYHLRLDVPEESADMAMEAPRSASVAQVLEAYRTAIAESDQRIREIDDPAAPMARAVDGRQLPLRWVLAHMTGETARHAGHADILREMVDGVTGR